MERTDHIRRGRCEQIHRPIELDVRVSIYVLISHVTNVASEGSPLTETEPASAFVGINQTVTYGSSGTMILDNMAGITDTGTTLLLLASGAYTTTVICLYISHCLQMHWRYM